MRGFFCSLKRKEYGQSFVPAGGGSSFLGQKILQSSALQYLYFYNIQVITPIIFIISCIFINIYFFNHNHFYFLSLFPLTFIEWLLTEVHGYDRYTLPLIHDRDLIHSNFNCEVFHFSIYSCLVVILRILTWSRFAVNFTFLNEVKMKGLRFN